MLASLDIFDPTSYPTRRAEEWKYSDLSRVLRVVPAHGGTYSSFSSNPNGISQFITSGEDYAGLEAVAKNAQGRLWIRHDTGIRHDSISDEVILGFQASGDIKLEAGESLLLFETYGGTEIYSANTLLRFKLGEGASLTRVVILDEPEDAISIRRSTVQTAPGSTFKQYVFSTGAKFQRFETHVEHAGRGAVVEMNGAYLLKDKRHFDLTTRVTHSEIDGTTSQLIKGLVRDTATGVFQGRILVEKGADGTDARMRHQALILNDGAHIRAKPELEIYADDVQCAHGNTIGALDEEALFFAMSRGIPEDAARAMLTQAFVLPVADMIEDEELRATVLKFLEEQVGAFHGL